MPTYETALKSDNTVVTRKESMPGSGNHDIVVSGLPSDAVPARVAGRRLVLFILDPKGQIDLTNFYDTGYYDPNFKFCVEFRGDESIDNRRRASQSAFTHWTIKPEHKSQLRAGEGILYCTENILGSRQPGHYFQFCSFQEFVNDVYPRVPGLGLGEWLNFRYFFWNIEGPNYLVPGNHNEPALPGWGGPGYYGKNGNPDWHSVKNQVIQLENSPEQITLEQYAARGEAFWNGEQEVRISNRFVLCLEMSRKKGTPDVQHTAGCALFTNFPNRDRKNNTDVWLNGNCRAQYAGGDADGNITLSIPEAGGTSWAVKLNGTPFDHQDFTDLYHYIQDPQISEEEKDKIFVQKLPGTQSCEYVWGKDVDNYVAREKGQIQHNWQRQEKRLLSKSRQPMWRQIEMIYEHHRYGLPWAEVQPVGQGETPRLWLPPVETYTKYAVMRFMMGATPNCGLYHFNENQASYLRNPFTDPDVAFRRFYNFPMHPYTAMFQARRDMQFLEQWYPGTYLIENAEVKFNQTGEWLFLDGIDCWDTYPNPKKNSHAIRWKPVNNPGEQGYYDVVIQSGSGQGWGEECTDLVRYPGIGFNMAEFRIKLRGPAPHLSRFRVPANESNQTYEAIYTSVPQFEKAGYAGLIQNPTA